MTSPDPAGPLAAGPQTDQTTKILELLDRLAKAESFHATASAAGLGEEEARSILHRAAEIIRQNRQPSATKSRSPNGGSLLDWHEMTIPEALEFLGEHAMSQNASPPLPSKEGGA